MRFSSLMLSHFCLLASQLPLRPLLQVSAFRSIPFHHGKHTMPEVTMGKPLHLLSVSSTHAHVRFRLCPMNTVDTGPLYMASSSSSQSTEGDRIPASPISDLNDDEVDLLEETFGHCAHDTHLLTQQLMERLPSLKPGLILKLKQAQSDPNETVRAISLALGGILDAQLEEGREILTSLLQAGEIRKMDALIGRAAREGKLDAAFFTVLNHNLQAAADDAVAAPDDADASRVQILQHVYTRCQEEVEKTVPPGIALLNKLLRTEIDSIRANQLNHYLCPQPNVIRSPDGTEIQLRGEAQILVPPPLLVDAIGKAVKQIRTVENAGGTDRASAATMVESLRRVAKEARMILGEHYGPESEEVLAFERGLQPVFRPDSPDSPYIKGE